MANKFISNSACPIPLPVLAAFISKESCTKDEKSQLLEIAARQADLLAKKGLYSPTSCRARLRAENRLFATGKGPEPKVTAEEAGRQGEALVRQFRLAFTEYFQKEGEPLIKKLLERGLEHAKAVLKRLHEQHEKEAKSFGLPYIAPPIILSVEKAIMNLEGQINYFESYPDNPPEMTRCVLPTFGLGVKPS